MLVNQTDQTMVLAILMFMMPSPKPAGKLRFAEGRVWDMYTVLTGDEDFARRHLDCAMGRDRKNPMPLLVKPEAKVTLDDVRTRMAYRSSDESHEHYRDVRRCRWRGVEYRQLSREH